MISPVIPSGHDLKPWLAKLESNEGSLVLIALESFRTRSDCRCTVGWFDATEKIALRKALLKAKAKRATRSPAPRHGLAATESSQQAKTQREDDGASPLLLGGHPGARSQL